MKIALFGSYGEGNLGDEAILDAVVFDIKAIYPEAEIIIFSHDLLETERRFSQDKSITIRPILPSGIRSLLSQWQSGELKKSINCLKQVDFAVIGGGGLFYDTEVKVGVNPILVWLIRGIILRFLKVKFIIYAVGAGPIKSKTSLFLLRILANLAQNISVRDRFSEKLLKSTKTYTPIVLSADPVWGKRWLLRSMQEIHQNPRLKYDAKLKVGIQVRLVQGMDESNFVETLSKIIDLFTEKYLLSVALIPLAYKNSEDKLLLEKIQINARNENKVQIVAPESLNGVSEIFQECDFLILSRMHSMIVATSLGIPFIALSYSPKTDDLITRLELTDFSWPVLEVDKLTIERLYLNLMKKKVTIRRQLLEKADFLRTETEKNRKLLQLVVN